MSSCDPIIFVKKKLSLVEKLAIISKGPFQPKKNELPGNNFPQKYGHRFTEDYYWRKLTGDDRVHRDWLTFSISKNRLFCFYCMFFGDKYAQKSWIEDGFQGWNRLGDISLHEKSSCHINGSIIVKLKQNSVAILPSLEEKKREEVAINRDVVNTLVEITKFLGKHSLSFRGHRENWSEANKGNFKDLAELISKWSPSLAIHIEKIKNKGRKEVNFLSWERQNQLIDSVASCIKLVIIKQLKESRYFSVSIDTTFDISKKEQLAFIIRYVNFEKTIPVINERLLALKESSITSGINLFTIFQEICAENGLNWRRFLVGQSYDGAANMRGEYAGLQALVCAENPAATYTWCYAHRLSLIVVQGSSSSQNAVDLFGNLESLYAFITSSKKRVSWFDNAQKTHYPKQRVHRLKRVETTRWFSLSSALNTVIITLNALIDTLIKIQQDEGCVDFKSGAKATGLIEYFLSERFILTAFLYIDIFCIVDPLTRILQSINIDLLGTIKSIHLVTDKIKELRKDNAYTELCKKTENYIENSDMEFSPLPIHRPRKKKRLPSEQIEDNPITDPKYEFKIKTYFVALDTIITAINDRFTSKSQNLLKDISLFSTKRLNEIKCKNSALPKDAFNSFCDVYSKFVQLDELKKEYVQFANYFSEFSNIMKLPKSIHNDYSVEVCDEDNLSDIGENTQMDDSDSDSNDKIDFNNENINLGSLLDLLKLCHMSGLKEVFPTLYTALHIATTLPVTSASPERTFSKLKIIKNRLRSTISQGKLENLMLISCENLSINNSDVIDKFAKLSSVLSSKLL